MGKRGYPLLLAAGETANGVDRLIDPGTANIERRATELRANIERVGAAWRRYRASGQALSGERLAQAEADRAMALLKQAVAAGYADVGHMKRDADLDAMSCCAEDAPAVDGDLADGDQNRPPLSPSLAAPCEPRWERQSRYETVIAANSDSNSSCSSSRATNPSTRAWAVASICGAAMRTNFRSKS